MNYTKLITMFLIGVILLGSVIYLYEKGVNGGCDKVADRWLKTKLETSIFTCGYNVFAGLILAFGIIGLIWMVYEWEDTNRYY